MTNQVYVLTLVVTDADGLTATASVNLTVPAATSAPLPQPPATVPDVDVDIHVRIDTVNLWNSATYTWTDITPYVKSFEIVRGRTDFLGLVPTGTARIDVDNQGGQFFPGTGGARLGLRLASRLQILAYADGRWRSLYFGLIRSIPTGAVQTDPTVTLQCIDVMTRVRGQSIALRRPQAWRRRRTCAICWSRAIGRPTCSTLTRTNLSWPRASTRASSAWTTCSTN